MDRRGLIKNGLASVLAPVFLSPILLGSQFIFPSLCFGTQYLTEEEVKNLVFPAGTDYTLMTPELSDSEIAKIESKCDQTVRNKTLRIWTATHAGADIGALFIDTVIGKHEIITYAVAVSPNGKVRQVEIMEYLESYGGQIRDAAWRNQFVNKELSEDLKVGKQIQNISGATISCIHVTDGIRRVLATHAVIFPHS